MPRKVKEEYNEYMNNYMNKRYNKQKQEKLKNMKIEAPAEKIDLRVGNGKEFGVNDIATTGKAVTQLAREFGDLKEEDKQYIDKIEKYITLGEKYLPLVLKFVEGFTTRLQDQSQQTQETQANLITPAPQGWDELSPMQRIGRKYQSDGSISAWYRQGEMHEEQKQLTPQNTRQNPTPNLQQYTPPQAQEPTSLQELARKHPEPKAIDTEEIKEPQEIKKQEEPKENENMEEVNKLIQNLTKDNEIYLKTGFEYLNKMENKELEKHLEKGTMFEMIEKYKMFIPTQTKTMIKNMEKEHVDKLLQDHAPEKYKYFKKKKLLEKVFEDFEKTKAKTT